MIEEWRNLRPEQYIRNGDEWWDERDATWNPVTDTTEEMTVEAFGGRIRRRLRDVATETMQLLADVRELQTRMTADERIKWWDAIVENYCIMCGCDDPENNCQCSKDE